MILHSCWLSSERSNQLVLLRLDRLSVCPAKLEVDVDWISAKNPQHVTESIDISMLRKMCDESRIVRVWEMRGHTLKALQQEHANSLR